MQRIFKYGDILNNSLVPDKQGCSGSGTRGNAVPINIFVREQHSGEHDIDTHCVFVMYLQVPLSSLQHSKRTKALFRILQN